MYHSHSFHYLGFAVRLTSISHPGSSHEILRHTLRPSSADLMVLTGKRSRDIQAILRPMFPILDA